MRSASCLPSFFSWSGLLGCAVGGKRGGRSPELRAHDGGVGQMCPLRETLGKTKLFGAEWPGHVPFPPVRCTCAYNAHTSHRAAAWEVSCILQLWISNYKEPFSCKMRLPCVPYTSNVQVKNPPPLPKHNGQISEEPSEAAFWHAALLNWRLGNQQLSMYLSHCGRKDLLTHISSLCCWPANGEIACSSQRWWLLPASWLVFSFAFNIICDISLHCYL